MKITVRGTPNFCVPFTLQLATSLKLLSQLHYDWSCREISLPGPNGIIHGILNSMEYGQVNVIEWPLTFRNLDLLMKVCEGRHGVSMTIAAHEELNRFVRVSLSALRMSGSICAPWLHEVS